MQRKWTENAQKVIENSRGEAIKLRCQNVEAEHLILSMLRLPQCRATIIINQLCDNIEALKQELLASGSVNSIDENLYEETNEISFSEECDTIIKAANIEAMKAHSNLIGTYHLLLGFFFKTGNNAAEILKKYGINKSNISKPFAEGSITIKVTTSKDFNDLLSKEIPNNIEEFFHLLLHKISDYSFLRIFLLIQKVTLHFFLLLLLSIFLLLHYLSHTL
jgi:ATP-dependent Clp protease ATP-binding subunit ClpA